MKTNSRYRNACGQGLVEGTVAICMIFGSGVVAMLLVLNSGTSMVFKEKLNNVTHLAAAYAAAHAGDSNVQEETTTFVAQLMPQAGISPTALTVEVNQVNIQQDPGVQVSISNQFPLFGTAGGIFPAQLTLTDSEVVVW